LAGPGHGFQTPFITGFSVFSMLLLPLPLFSSFSDEKEAKNLGCANHFGSSDRSLR